MTIRPCAIVPSRNHWQALPDIVGRLRALGLPVFVIDDGSDEPAAAAIASLDAPAEGVTVHRLAVNRGKGAAVAEGFRHAIAGGFTHAVQADADGQHELGALPELLARARAHPHAVVSGYPAYDASVPRSRRIGRWATHVWVFVETLSFRITDSMCGLRVYPLDEVGRLLATEKLGRRMDFDTEIMVRLFWRGVPPIMVPVRVTYPPGNLSNFDLVADNLRITWMHTRLVLGALLRLPSILRHRPPPLEATAHWAQLRERGAFWGLRFIAAAYRLLGRGGCRAVMAPIVFYFYVTGETQRRASLDFLARAFAATGSPRRITWWHGYRHVMDFASRALDAFAAWTGGIPSSAMAIDDPQTLESAAADPRGALLVVSHVGNVELARALMRPDLRRRLTVLAHSRNAEHYNRLVARFRDREAGQVMQVTDVGPDMAIALRERIARGEWVAIAGDRVPVLSQGRIYAAPFLGGVAPFPQGPWLLGSLLECPVYLFFCRREGACWKARLEPFSDRIVLPRCSRETSLAEYVAGYARRLEAECLFDPFQWYNFFDFAIKESPPR